MSSLITNADYSIIIEELTANIKRLIEENNICGLSIALVDDKETIWAKGFGYTDHSKKESVTAHTLFSSQSFGKCLTATAFLIMVSKGLIGLDDPIREYYPDFTVNTKFGDLEEEIAKITFRRMLSHWAGFTHEAPLGNNYNDTPCSFEEHVKSINESWLKSPVGSEFSYANLGYELTGYVMGLVMNKTYEEVMEEVLLNPLRMNSATYNIEEAFKQSFAKGHSGKFAVPVMQVPMLPSGGIYISANDVAKFISFHLRNGENNNLQLIETALFEDMYTPQYFEEKEFGYGLGIYSYQTIGNATAYGHTGGGYGYQTMIQWIPKHNVGIVLLTNDMKHNIRDSLTKKALELMIDAKLKPKPEPIKAEMLQRLEGTYSTDENTGQQLVRISYEDGKLLYYAGGSETELIPQSPTEFLSISGTKYRFKLNDVDFPLSLYVDDPIFPFKAKYNDGPKDNPGPNDLAWQKQTGIYQFQEYGRIQYLALSVTNGYLYVTFGDNLKVKHYKDNLFFTADGELLILHNDELNFMGIPAKKIDLDIDQVINVIKSDKNNLDAYYITAITLVHILIATDRISEAISFAERVVEIDESFKIIYSRVGDKMYTFGKYKEAHQLFTKLTEIDTQNERDTIMLKKIKEKLK